MGGQHERTHLSPCIFFTVEATIKWWIPLMSTSPVLSIDTNRHYIIVKAKTRYHNVAYRFHSYAQSKEAVFDCQNTRVYYRM